MNTGRRLGTVPFVICLCLAVNWGRAATPVYSFTGTTASGDSAITAWFQFSPTAMADQLVFFYEIPQHRFEITGSNLAMNGWYDRFLGGGIVFNSSVPGPNNLPASQSLIIENSANHYYVQSDFSGHPDIFLGGPSGTGTIYTGAWSYGLIPEPSSVSLLGVAAALGCLLKKWVKPTARGSQGESE